ncbi:MAG: pseudouridine synthase [Candidatus Omnitrophica bacterium]|nr:pseudouridine synthase [Candidatus Omnitrophota bacterium]
MEKRLQNVLAHAGISSRRGAADLIARGKVKVDGRVVTEKGYKLDPRRHEIFVNGQALPREEKKYYILFNKPTGVISTVKDTHGRKKVTDFFKDIKARLYPVGRLDKDTTGILIITNDGELANKLMHPRFEIEKEYQAMVNGFLAPADKERLEKGIMLEGIRTSPCIIRRVKRTRDRDVLRIKIHEGRKRQIKRMFEEVGLKVTELERTGYAGLRLGRIKRGDYRFLTESEVERLSRIGENDRSG